MFIKINKEICRIFTAKRKSTRKANAFFLERWSG